MASTDKPLTHAKKDIGKGIAAPTSVDVTDTDCGYPVHARGSLPHFRAGNG